MLTAEHIGGVETLRFFYLIVALASGSALLPSLAEAAPADCTGLMHFGIVDKYDTLSLDERIRATKAWVCQSNFGSYQEALNSANRLGVSVDIFSLSFGGNTAQSNWGTWSSSFCAMSQTQLASRTELVSKVQVISPVLMRAVETCIEAERSGLQTWIETTQDRAQFTLHVKYTQLGSEKAVFTNDVVFTPRSVAKNCQPLSLVKAGKEITRAGVVVTCAVQPSQTITVTVNTTQGIGAPHLEGYKPPVITEKSDGSKQTIKAVEPAPITVNFEVIKNPIAMGQKAIFKWSTTNASTVTLNPGNIALGASGTYSIAPTSNTTYTLTAMNQSAAPAHQSIDVQVDPKIRLYEHINREGASLDVNAPGAIPNPLNLRASSLEIFSDEWVKFYYMAGLGIQCVVVKGPKYLPQLHDLGFGDSLITVQEIRTTKPDMAGCREIP